MRRTLLALVALTLAACGRAEPEAPPPPPEPPVLEDRLALPQMDIAGYRALVEDITAGGTPLVVNIWGSWCPPCRAEAPGLGRLAREYDGRVEFLGVDILDDRESARDFILEFDWQYPSIFDPKGAIRDGLGYVGQPITIVYDLNGEVAFEWVGAIGEEQLRAEIRKVL